MRFYIYKNGKRKYISPVRVWVSNLMKYRRVGNAVSNILYYSDNRASDLNNVLKWLTDSENYIFMMEEEKETEFDSRIYNFLFRPIWKAEKMLTGAYGLVEGGLI